MIATITTRHKKYRVYFILVLSFYDVEEDIGRRREGVILVNLKEPTAGHGGADHLAKLAPDADKKENVDYLLEYDDAIEEYATRESAESDWRRRDDGDGIFTAGRDEIKESTEPNEIEEALCEFFSEEREHPKNVSKRLARTVRKAMTRSSNLARRVDTFGLPPIEVMMRINRSAAVFVYAVSLGSAQPESYQK